MTHALAHELNLFAELRRRLVEADPDIDEVTLFDTLEGATRLQEAISEVIRVILMEEALADALRDRLSAMRERLDRLETTAEKKREVVLAVMEEADIEKILQPDFTVPLRISPPAVCVVNEAEVPEAFWIPQPPKLDRKGILESLKAGQKVAGASFTNSKVSLAIRVR
jgi:hypothetical protein